MNWKKWTYATAIFCGLYCSVLQEAHAESSSSSHTTKWRFSLKNQVVTGKSPFPCPPPVIDPDSFPYPNTQVEPALAVGPNPIDPRHPMVVIAYQEDRYNSAGGASANYMIISFDGGKTFGKPVPLPTVTCFGGPFERATDPHIVITNHGNILFSGIPFNALGGDFVTSLSISKYNVRKEKFVYTKYLDLANANVDPFTSTDFDGLFLDPQDPSGKLAYVTWDFLTFPDNGPFATSVFKFSKTTDGTHWSKPTIIDPFSPDSLAKFGEDVGPVFVGFDFFNNPGKPFSKLLATFALAVNGDFIVPPYNQASFTYTMVSDNQGKTWTNPIPVNNTLSDVMGQVIDPDNQAPIRVAGGGTIVDRERNIIYLVTQEHSLVYDGIPTQVVLYYSLDDAASWNLVGPINTDLSTQAFGASTCLIDEGRFAVSYYDFRNYHGNSVAEPLLTDRWMDIYYFDKESRTLTLETEIRLTDTSFNYRFAPSIGGSVAVVPGLFLGDYFGQVFFERQIFHVFGIVPQGAGPNSAHLQLSILTQKTPIPGSQ